MRFLFVFLLSFQAFSFPLIPNILIAQTSICKISNPDFDGLRYFEQVAHCRRKVSTRTKDIVCSFYGVFDRTDYTVDHIIPLSIGGTNAINNLWCQHRSIMSANYEFQLYWKLRRGEVRQSEAIRDILIYKFSGARY